MSPSLRPTSASLCDIVNVSFTAPASSRSAIRAPALRSAAERTVVAGAGDGDAAAAPMRPPQCAQNGSAGSMVPPQCGHAMVLRGGVAGDAGGAGCDDPRFGGTAACTAAGADMTRAADALTDLPQSMQKRAPS